MPEKISVKIENLPKSQVKISIVVPATEMENFIQQAAEDLSKTLKVDGFRAGKIPFDVVERTVGSETLLHEGAEKAIKKTYVDAVLDNKIEAIGQPKIEIKKIASGNDLEFEAVVSTLPAVKIGDWKEEVAKVNEDSAKNKIEVKDEEIQRELEFLAKQRAKIVTVNREAQKGDQVEIDFEVWRNGAPIEHGTAKKHLLVLGEGRFIPGFEDQLLGASANQEKDFELEFPKDYHEKSLAGQKAQFKVKVNLVQERQVPEINDEFASSVGKFKNLDELKHNIKEGIEHEEMHKAEDQHKRKLLDEIVKKTEAEIPQVLIDSEVERMMSELENEIAMIGLSKEVYFDQLKTSEEKLKEQWKNKEAIDRVKAALALKTLAKENQLEPSSQEVEEQMNKYLQYYKSTKDMEKNLDLERLYEMVKGTLTNERVLKFLMEYKK